MLVGVQNGKALCKFLTKLNILLPYDYAPKELKAYVHTKNCTKIAIEASFIIVKT